MIDKKYKEKYRSIFTELLSGASKGFYDECTLPSYAHVNPLVSWLFWKRVDLALTLAGDLRGKRVLDFGCGGGVLFEHLREQGCRITGCEDQFPRLAAAVSEKLGAQATICGGLTDLAARSFDRIFALDVLEHIDDLDTVISGFRKLSNERTEIVISGPTENFLYQLGRHAIGYAEQGRFHERTIYDIEARFKENDLKKRKARTLFPVLPLFRVSSWTLSK